MVPTTTGAPDGLIRSAADRLQRALLFGAVTSRLSWRVLARIYRHRPFLTTLGGVMNIEGDVIECGVYWGRSAILIAAALRDGGAPDKKVFALDSFSGFPADSVGACDVGEKRDIETLRGRFRQHPSIVRQLRMAAARLKLNLEVVPGRFEQTLPGVVRDRRFCFVHLDCDVYASYRVCLPLLYPRLVPGGIMLFDEYRSREWPGATLAIDEFLAEKPERPVLVQDAARPGLPKYLVVKQ